MLTPEQIEEQKSLKVSVYDWSQQMADLQQNIGRANDRIGELKALEAMPAPVETP